ncbi:MAG: CinA family protein [Clostridia bacterium]|nr:CinA family protein [Clostridia bacterium]
MIELYEYLVKNNVTVATAESCTGGMIASEFISYPGISGVFLAGFVTYANETKEKLLGVKGETLKQFGAVSRECALEMLKGTVEKTGADAAICTTGIAGPGGGTKDKPVGLVYVGAFYKGEVKIEKCHFSGDRQQVRSQATEFAQKMLMNMLIKEI